MSYIRGTTMIALSLAEIAKKRYGTPYDRDMLISACLLHDVTKVLESESGPQVCQPAQLAFHTSGEKEQDWQGFAPCGLCGMIFDKELLSIDGCIAGLFLFVKGYYARILSLC